jgi:hypothetical protein
VLEKFWISRSQVDGRGQLSPLRYEIFECTTCVSVETDRFVNLIHTAVVVNEFDDALFDWLSMTVHSCESLHATSSIASLDLTGRLVQERPRFVLRSSEEGVACTEPLTHVLDEGQTTKSSKVPDGAGYATRRQTSPASRVANPVKFGRRPIMGGPLSPIAMHSRTVGHDKNKSCKEPGSRSFVHRTPPSELR